MTLSGSLQHSLSADLQIFHKSLDEGRAGEYLGTLLRGVKREAVRRGMVLCAPGTLQSHTKFKAQVMRRGGGEGGGGRSYCLSLLVLTGVCVA